MGKIKISRQLPEMTFEECYGKWRKHCIAGNYAEKTVTYYDNTIHVFNKFFDKTRFVDEIGKETVEDYVIFLRDSGVRDTTIKTYIGGLRTVLYFFMREGWVEKFNINVPKTVKQIKDIYTEEELRRLLKKPNMKKCSFAQYRNWVLVNYFIGTGQRENSVINIKIGDLDLDNGIVKLTETKNKKQTLLPLGDNLICILRDYLKIRGGSKEDYAFCTDRGEKMTSSCVISAIREYNKSRGVNKSSIHLFRHTFATNWVRHNGDIVKLQHILCHEDLKTTQKYLNVTLNDLISGYQEMNPLERMLDSKKQIRV